MRQRVLRRCRGFSLVEIMIVLAIIGLLMAVSIPVIRSWMANREVSEAADRLQAELRQASSMASSSGVDVTFGGTPVGTVADGYCIWKDGRKTATGLINKAINIRMAANFNQVNAATTGTNVIFYHNGAAVGGFGYLASGYVVNATNGAGVGGEIILDNGSRAMRLRLTRTGSVSVDQVNPGVAAANI